MSSVRKSAAASLWIGMIAVLGLRTLHIFARVVRVACPEVCKWTILSPNICTNSWSLICSSSRESMVPSVITSYRYSDFTEINTSSPEWLGCDQAVWDPDVAWTVPASFWQSGFHHTQSGPYDETMGCQECAHRFLRIRGGITNIRIIMSPESRAPSALDSGDTLYFKEKFYLCMFRKEIIINILKKIACKR